MASIVIIGTGPAGLSCYKRIRESSPESTITIVDAGKHLADRLKDHSSSSVVNGAGGAGLYADRKFSAFPAGTGLLKTNKHHLLESHKEVFAHIESVVPSLKFKLDNLYKHVESFIGDETVSYEELERREKAFHYTLYKGYSSLVMDSVDDAINLIQFYKDCFDDKNVYFETNVIDVTKNEESGQLSFELSNDLTIVCDYLVMAMGRFGGMTMSKFNLFEEKDFHSQRIEIGFRIDLESYPELRKALIEKSRKYSMCCDLKVVKKTKFVVTGKEIDGECRTFCVCDPKIRGENTQGYAVLSRDTVTELETFSGSSSYDELTKRFTEETSHVFPGSNLGVMFRFKDPEIVNLFLSQSDQIKGNKIFEIDPEEGIEHNVALMAQVFPKDFCYAIYSSIIGVIESLIDKPVDHKVKLYGPCVEGIGYYPKVDQHTYQMENHSNVYVAGDMVGHTRGLLQALVMGDVVGKYIMTAQLEKEMEGYLHSYQSLTLPETSYNKVSWSNRKSSYYKDKYAMMESRIEDLYLDDIVGPDEDAITKRTREIYDKLHPVKFTGNSKGMGVIYEIHHFFLDKNVYGKNEQLHYISQDSMLLYILMCNVVESNKAVLLDHLNNVTTNKKVQESVLKTVKNYLFKSCVLALRTRESIEKRDQYHDIPVMQSAFHFMPLTKEIYDSLNPTQALEIQNKLVATTCAFLDVFFKSCIEKFDLPLIMCRSKIETQEPAVDNYNAGTEPLYLECHVKVKMQKKDGSSISYHEKKNLIQDLASLVEGPNAVDADLFNVVAVSINLLKHLEHGQQFFLTFRTDRKEEMYFVHRNFSKTFKHLISTVDRFLMYDFKFIPDAEFVVYDDNRALDTPWFPVTKNFMNIDYKINIERLLNANHHLYMVTSNPNKVRELQRTINREGRWGVKYAIHRSDIPLNEPSIGDFKESTIKKAIEAYDKVKHPVIVENSGLVISGIFPGALTRQVIEGMGYDTFVKGFKNHEATATTCMIYYDGEREPKIAMGSIDGTIVEARGENGFGWDSIFEVEMDKDGVKKTFAQFTDEEKCQISMRTEAMKKLVSMIN